MSNPYNAKNLLKHSYFVDACGLETPLFRMAILEGYTEYVARYLGYCTEDNFDILCNVFYAITAYHLYVNAGRKPEEARDLLKKQMFAYLGKNRIQAEKDFGKGFKGKVRKIEKELGRINGPSFTVSVPEVDDSHIRIAVSHCLIKDIMEAEGCLYVGQIFCDLDLFLFQSIPGTAFIRKDTLIKTGKSCEMEFRRGQMTELEKENLR